MIDFFLDQNLPSEIVELLQTGPSELIVVLQNEANVRRVVKEMTEIRFRLGYTNDSCTIIYAYDNGRTIEL